MERFVVGREEGGGVGRLRRGEEVSQAFKNGHLMH